MENVAYSAVSNMQPRLNALEESIHLIGMRIYEMQLPLLLNKW